MDGRKKKSTTARAYVSDRVSWSDTTLNPRDLPGVIGCVSCALVRWLLPFPKELVDGTMEAFRTGIGMSYRAQGLLLAQWVKAQHPGQKVAAATALGSE